MKEEQRDTSSLCLCRFLRDYSWGMPDSDVEGSVTYCGWDIVWFLLEGGASQPSPVPECLANRESSLSIKVQCVQGIVTAVRIWLIFDVGLTIHDSCYAWKLMLYRPHQI